MKLGFKKGEKGFTLVELMVVMGIMAVLATIVVPAVTGQKQLSLNTQVKQDASSVETAVGKYNVDVNSGEALTTDNSSVVGEAANQTTSSSWPEDFIVSVYATEFPATAGTQADEVSSVTIQSDNGTVLYGTGEESDLADFVADYNAIDIDTLVDTGYLQEEPNGFDLVFSSSKPYHSFLWLVKKVLVEDDEDGGRSVEVYRLVEIDEGTTDALIYKRMF